MIENTIPKKFIIENIQAGYTKVYFAHSSYVDEDIQGKAYWLNDTTRILDGNLGRFYSVLPNLTAATPYTVQAAYYDAMVDDELLDNKVGVILSDTSSFTTKIHPTITGITVTSEQVDIGVGTPVANLSIAGDSTRLVVEASKTGTNEWQTVFSGSSTPVISLPLQPGKYTFRVTGFIDLPDGLTTDISPTYYSDEVAVEYKFTPPSAPTNLQFKAAKLMDGIERYDLKVGWDWDKATGANVREFVLYFTTTDEYNKNQWSTAQVINGGAAKSVVITGFPFNKEYKFRVDAVAWGPGTDARTSSSVGTFIIDKNTPLDSSFTNETGIEVTYDHIKAYRVDNGVRKQTFLLDAATGGVAIGQLDDKGNAPISVDPTSGNVNVDGAVISKTMYSASFVMSNLTGKDNPEIRTSNKPNYAAAGDGLWTGYDSTDGKYKLDVGNATQFIRFDGDDLVISGNVKIGTPTGDVDIGQGIKGNFIANIFKEAASQPTTPTGTAYPPTGWSRAPLSPINNPVWVSSAIIDSKTGLVASSSSWSTPAQFAAVAGEDGAATVLIYRNSVSTPPAPTSNALPPSEWFTTPPARAAGSFLWVSSGIRRGSNNNIEGSWSLPTKFTGDKGDAGTDGKNGKDGKNGTNGKTYYTWVKYADTASGGGISNSPLNKEFIGIAYNKSSSSASNNPADYTWSLFKGTQGIPGRNGSDGKTYYTWIKYADDQYGNGMSDNPTGKKYLGIATNKTTATESSNKSEYTWILIEGPQGKTGIPGRNGADGVTYYTWVKYADTAAGSGISDNPTNKEYIGIAVNKTSPIQSNNPSEYVWSRTKGDQGVPGSKGDDGTTYYTWIKYANTATGSGMSDDPTNKEYIGIAYNKTSRTEGTNPADYTWSKIQGKDGKPGKDGTNGKDGKPGKDGSKGADGSRGPGFYAQTILNLTAFNATEATRFFNTAFGTSPVLYDVITQYNAADISKAFTRQWNGSAWVEAALLVHGNMIVRGSITADRLVADAAFLQKMGVNQIYDTAAAVSNNPESIYKMKIDLAKGSIHIR